MRHKEVFIIKQGVHLVAERVEKLQIVVHVVAQEKLHIQEIVDTENHHHTTGVQLTAKTHQQTTNIINKNEVV